MCRGEYRRDLNSLVPLPPGDRSAASASIAISIGSGVVGEASVFTRRRRGAPSPRLWGKEGYMTGPGMANCALVLIPDRQITAIEAKKGSTRDAACGSRMPTRNRRLELTVLAPDRAAGLSARWRRFPRDPAPICIQTRTRVRSPRPTRSRHCVPADAPTSHRLGTNLQMANPRSNECGVSASS